MKKFILSAAITLMAFVTTYAQSWLTTGNAATTPGTNFLGTTDSKGLVFKTNAIERMRITNTGSVGIGTTAPVGALNVAGTEMSSITSPGFLQLGSKTGYNLGLDDYHIQARYNGGYSNLYLNYYGGTTYVGSNLTSSYGLSATGINTGVYGYGSTYGGYFYNPDGTGVYGYDAGTGHGVYGYETGSGEGVDGYAYGSFGYGVLGYSAQSVGVYGITNVAGGYGGYFTGNVYCSGTYTGSDQKLKQNISDMSSAMTIINQLKPKTYNFRQDGSYKLMNLPQGLQYGLIAQDVEKVLPTLVKDTKFDVDKSVHSPETAPDPKNLDANLTTKAAAKTGEVIDFKALNYTELIPIMIKGMQEQQETIDKQQLQIDELKQMVQTLTNNAGNKTTSSPGSITTVSGAYLQQNIPNPFSNATIISYKLPQGYSSAKLVVTNKTGVTIKEINLSGSIVGSISIDASTLSSGAYQYSLYVNGRLIDSKQMILAR